MNKKKKLVNSKHKKRKLRLKLKIKSLLKNKPAKETSDKKEIKKKSPKAKKS
ncbi:MAG: hypothetical protein VW204_03905 [Pelagibacteraceae bacterium]|jgi:hypothetical protein